MTRRTCGILTSVFGVAIGAWWWAMQRSSAASRRLTPPRERGTVIFDNTPTVASDAII